MGFRRLPDAPSRLFLTTPGHYSRQSTERSSTGKTVPPRDVDGDPPHWSKLG